MTSDRYVTIAWVYDAGELALLLSLFEWEEIPIVPLGYLHAAVQWNILVALGGIRLRAREEDTPAALALLASLERTPQTSVRFFARDKLVDILLVLLFFFPAASPCRHGFRPISRSRVASARPDLQCPRPWWT